MTDTPSMSMSATDHRHAVDAFFREAKARDPDRYAEVCEQFPVLSWRMIKNRKSHEISLSMLDGDEAERYG